MILDKLKTWLKESIKHFDDLKLDEMTFSQLFLPLAFGVIIIWLLGGYLIYRFSPGPGDPALTMDPGSFGDMFGSVNALFSGLAFAGVICTLLLQRRELQLQREENKQARKEFERQSLAQELSAQVNGYSSVIQSDEMRVKFLESRIRSMPSTTPNRLEYQAEVRMRREKIKKNLNRLEKLEGKLDEFYDAMLNNADKRSLQQQRPD